MDSVVTILGFAGSLRKDSYNKALLKTAKEVLPENIKLEIFDLQMIPLFNQDLENHMPKIVKEFKAKIKNADALLIATPEYNYSFSGVLKNAIDWASRPYGDNSFKGKPVAVTSASPGMLRGARAQYICDKFLSLLICILSTSLKLLFVLQMRKLTIMERLLMRRRGRE